MTETNKKTQRDYYNELLTNYNLTDELIEFINGRIAQLDKKAESSKKAVDEEQVQLINDTYEFVVNHPGTTIAACRKATGLTSQKLTPVFTKLVSDGKISKITEKRTSYFTAV